jgi:hypothetical protein
LRDPILNGSLPPLSVYVSAVMIVALFAGSAATALRYQERRLIFHL